MLTGGGSMTKSSTAAVSSEHGEIPVNLGLKHLFPLFDHVTSSAPVTRQSMEGKVDNGFECNHVVLQYIIYDFSFSSFRLHSRGVPR